jgi:hypothetical protein
MSRIKTDASPKSVDGGTDTTLRLGISRIEKMQDVSVGTGATLAGHSVYTMNLYGCK